MRESVRRWPVSLAAFLGLDHLVQAVLPGAVGHHAAGEFVDDLHLVRRRRCSAGRGGRQCRALSAFSMSSCRQVAERHTPRRAARGLGHALAAARSVMRISRCADDLEVAAALELARRARRPVANSAARLVAGFLGLGNDQRACAPRRSARCRLRRRSPRAGRAAACGGVRAPPRSLRRRRRDCSQAAGGQPVLQVVEHHFLVGDVDDVAGVLRAPLARASCPAEIDADRQPKQRVERQVALRRRARRGSR